MIQLRTWSNEFEKMYYADRDDTDLGMMKREYAPFVFELGFSRFRSEDMVLMLGSNYPDKSNTIMFEDDFVKLTYDGNVFIGEIKRIDGCFWLCFSNGKVPLYQHESKCYEVLGNRYEDFNLVEDLD